MQISVTKHAIERYRQRFFDFTKFDAEIEILLKEVARKGKKVERRPVATGECIEVRYQGISVVILNQKDETVIVTCLGDTLYRKWIKNKDKKSICGRLLYPA